MTQLTRPDGAVIHYEITGSGKPILALASGGAVSGIDRWRCEPIHPVDAFSQNFSVIMMDQRYAGLSRAPLTPFTHEQALGDQLAVLDKEGIPCVQVLGAGIGCSHALRLLYEAPARITSAVLLDPVGIDDSNSMDTFFDLFRDTIRVARAEGLSGVVSAALDNPSFVANPAGGPWAQRLHDETSFRDTLMSMGRENYIALVVDFRDGLWPWQQTCFSINDVALTRISAPVLVFPGNDLRHPSSIAQKICRDIPNAKCFDQQNDPAEVIQRFFADVQRTSKS